MAKEELKLLKYKELEDSIDDSPTQFSRTPKVDVDHTKTCKSRKRKQSPNEIDKVQLSALRRAAEVQANLDPKFPILVKYMLPSHVSSCFWLGLPLKFCKSYLPKEDKTMTLLTENGEEYPVKFLAEKTGLSGGWRGFSILQKLVEGDVVVFHLIKATKFKVYIIRENELADVDGTLGLLDLDARAEQTDPDDNADKVIKPKKFRRKRLKSLPASILQDNYKSTSPSVSGLDLALPTEQTGNVSEEVNSEVKDGIKYLEYNVEFKDIKNLESFTIMVNGSNIDSEIPKYVKTKYYDLCCSQNAFLHDHLPKIINCKLVAGIISETVNIADAIAASKLTTSQNEFTIWDKSLDAFEQLGMNVGFLRSRLQRLLNLVYESEQAMESKRYREALLGQTQVEEEMRTIEAKLSELREASKNFQAVVENLKVKAKRHELKFYAEASTHW